MGKGGGTGVGVGGQCYSLIRRERNLLFHVADP